MHCCSSRWWIDFSLRLIVGVVFLVYAIQKIINPEGFAIEVRGYELLPDPYVALIALTLPWFEVFAAIGLIARRFYEGSLLAITGMLAFFIVLLGYALAIGLEDCGCGLGMAPGIQIAIEVVLLGMVIALWVLNPPKNSEEAADSPAID